MIATSMRYDESYWVVCWWVFNCDCWENLRLHGLPSTRMSHLNLLHRAERQQHVAREWTVCYLSPL